jgi:PAS domain S-box-containing protein
LILFEENVKSVYVNSSNFLFDKKGKNEVLKLREEIKATKESLQAIVEEKDAVNQSLWTSNEEVLSTNEELQSVNEEMEAAKEELEASNEELIALNEELQKKNIALIKSTEYSEKLVRVLKKKESVLKESENNLRALFNAMTDIVFELDYEGKYISIASSLPELMYKPSKETVGKRLHDVFPQNEADVFLKFIQKTLDENQTNTIEYSLSINNKIMWFEGRATPKSKNTVLYIGRDITLQKQREIEKINLEKQLRHTQKLETIGTLAGGIAHDFNNILAPIMGYTEMALLKLTKTEPLYKDLQNVLNGAHRAKELVEQILLFSKQNEKKRIHVRVQNLIREALKLLRPSIPSTIEIHQDIDSRCPKIFADSTQIHQVIINLCTNAWQSMEEQGGVLSIELKKIRVDSMLAKSYSYLVEADYVCLSIIDTGVGMDTNTMERMFEPFYTTKSIDKGTGLGLSVVHGIVHSHNGEIIVDSELNKGTQIHIYLPLANSTDLLEESKTEEIIRGVEYVMIVDDEPSILEMLKDMLEHFGYKTEAFKTAIEAMKAFNQAPNKFDLVLTDLTMPKITGLELADQLHQIIPNFPVIIMTGFGDNIAEVTKERYSIKKTICKPIIIKELTGAIRDLLDNK